MFVRFHFVFDLLFNIFEIARITFRPSVGKELPLDFSLVLFLFSAVLNVGVPVPFDL